MPGAGGDARAALPVRPAAPGLSRDTPNTTSAGIAVLPEAAARRHAGELSARIVSLDDAWATRELRLCVRSMGELSVQARQLLAYLTGARAATAPNAGRE